MGEDATEGSRFDGFAYESVCALYGSKSASVVEFLLRVFEQSYTGAYRAIGKLIEVNYGK